MGIDCKFLSVCVSIEVFAQLFRTSQMVRKTWDKILRHFLEWVANMCAAVFEQFCYESGTKVFCCKKVELTGAYDSLENFNSFGIKCVDCFFFRIHV